MENDSMVVADTGEKVVQSTKRHWAILFPPFFLLLFAGLNVPSKGSQAWVLVLISLVWIALAWTNFQTAWFRLTKTRFLIKMGFPFPKTHDIPLDTIRSATVYQPVLGKFLDFGKVRILCTDGNKKFIRMVASPYQIVGAIYEYKALLEEGTKTETPE
jgi:uncharacterized membrane protein YdbT with pleckstrin-like domain